MIIDLTLIITFAFLAALLLEAILIRRCVNQFKVRVLVNGTRGKSSVVKYIHAGLSNTSALAKITGVIPTIILPDGVEQVIHRRGPARVQEQIRTIRLATKLKVENIVLECMSINPELQKLESRLLKPNFYVITNIRNDHSEQMGANILEQVHSICNAIPYNCKVITAEKEYLNIIKEAAIKKKSEVIEVQELNNFQIDDNMLSINLSIAATVCELIGINKEEAINSIIAKNRVSEKLSFILPKESFFINGFAVNDIPSAEEFLVKWLNEFKDKNEAVVLFNSRKDRPLRTVQFAEWLSKKKNITRIVLTGNHQPRAFMELRSKDYDLSRITLWNSKAINKFFDSVNKLNLENALIIGIGNIAGDGFTIINKLREGDNK